MLQLGSWEERKAGFRAQGMVREADMDFWHREGELVGSCTACLYHATVSFTVAQRQKQAP